MRNCLAKRCAFAALCVLCVASIAINNFSREIEWRAGHSKEWGETRSNDACLRVEAAIEKANWPPCNTNYCWSGTTLADRCLYRFKYCMHLARFEATPFELEEFANEVEARFNSPVTCRTVVWFFERVGALGPRTTASAHQFQSNVVAELLYPMDCPLTNESQRIIERGERVCDKCSTPSVPQPNMK